MSRRKIRSFSGFIVIVIYTVTSRRLQECPFPQRNWPDSRVCRKTPYNSTLSDNCWCPISAWWPVHDSHMRNDLCCARSWQMICGCAVHKCNTKITQNILPYLLLDVLLLRKRLNIYIIDVFSTRNNNPCNEYIMQVPHNLRLHIFTHNDPFSVHALTIMWTSLCDLFRVWMAS